MGVQMGTDGVQMGVQMGYRWVIHFSTASYYSLVLEAGGVAVLVIPTDSV